MSNFEKLANNEDEKVPHRRSVTKNKAVLAAVLAAAASGASATENPKAKNMPEETNIEHHQVESETPKQKAEKQGFYRTDMDYGEIVDSDPREGEGTFNNGELKDMRKAADTMAESGRKPESLTEEEFQIIADMAIARTKEKEGNPVLKKAEEVHGKAGKAPIVGRIFRAPGKLFNAITGKDIEVGSDNDVKLTPEQRAKAFYDATDTIPVAGSLAHLPEDLTEVILGEDIIAGADNNKKLSGKERAKRLAWAAINSSSAISPHGMSVDAFKIISGEVYNEAMYFVAKKGIERMDKNKLTEVLTQVVKYVNDTESLEEIGVTYEFLVEKGFSDYDIKSVGLGDLIPQTAGN